MVISEAVGAEKIDESLWGQSAHMVFLCFLRHSLFLHLGGYNPNFRLTSMAILKIKFHFTFDKPSLPLNPLHRYHIPIPYRFYFSWYDHSGTLKIDCSLFEI